MTDNSANRIVFLGTAGSRYVVSKQLRSSGGIFMSLAGYRIIIDPGPGCMVRLASRRPRIDPHDIDIIILTHKHIDHSSDINVLIDGMTDGGINAKGVLLAPRDALEDDPVVLHYVRSFLDDLIVIEEGMKLELDGLVIEAPLKMKHTVETYGFRFHTDSGSISHVPDTAYFPGISKKLKADVTIINVVLTRRREGIYHLSIDDSKKLLSEMRPKLGIVTHFGMFLLRLRPAELVQSMADELGISVLAARDGMTVDIDEVTRR